VSDIESRLNRCFAAVFPGLTPEKIPNASVDTVEKWDSVAGITLVTTIEEEFGIDFDPDALEHLVSYRLILDYLKASSSSQS
jgi:acyl carrier protein